MLHLSDVLANVSLAPPTACPRFLKPGKMCETSGHVDVTPNPTSLPPAGLCVGEYGEILDSLWRFEIFARRVVTPERLKL